MCYWAQGHYCLELMLEHNCGRKKVNTCICILWGCYTALQASEWLSTALRGRRLCCTTVDQTNFGFPLAFLCISAGVQENDRRQWSCFTDGKHRRNNDTNDVQHVVACSKLLFCKIVAHLFRSSVHFSTDAMATTTSYACAMFLTFLSRSSYSASFNTPDLYLLGRSRTGAGG